MNELKTTLIIIAVVLAGVYLVDSSSPTGLVVDEEIHAKNLNNLVNDFFRITNVQFPSGACSLVARDIFYNLVDSPVDVTAGFITDGDERIASVNFVTDRTRKFGTIDLSYGNKLLEEDNANSMISTSTSAIVNVPKRSRVNFLNMDLYGYSDGSFYVNKGRFSTPTMDCAFVRNNGETICDCVSHTISGMEIAGITAYRPPEDMYENLIKFRKIQ